MNHQELKLAITEDIQRLKSLDLDIIPARQYYLSLLKLVAASFWKCGLIIFCTVLYAAINNPSNNGLAREPHLQIMAEAAGIAFFMSLGAMLLLFHALNYYYLFQYHLEQRLKTGGLLAKKLRQAAYLFWILFALCCLMFASYAESAVIFIMIGFSFLISAFFTFLLASMEINRVGMSTIFTLINQFFNKT